MPPLPLPLHLSPPHLRLPLPLPLPRPQHIATPPSPISSILTKSKRQPQEKQPNYITHSAISIPSTYARQHSSPSAGVIVGATLGAVAAFLLLLYLLYLSVTSGRRFSASTVGPTTGSATGTTTTPSEIVDVGFRPRPRIGPQAGGGGGRRMGYFDGRGRMQRERQRQRQRQRGDEVVVEEANMYANTNTEDDGGVVEVIEEESVVDPPPSESLSSSESSRRGRRERYKGYRRARG
ncbi:hypothetical protein BJX61DRAFT_86776 [Aspergillus egyptiacus]|nr:hypothetical protein BJX61DRAFT_86776 [Aspergillus egyptiacus]